MQTLSSFLWSRVTTTYLVDLLPVASFLAAFLTFALAGRRLEWVALQAAGTPVTLRMYDRASHATLIGAFASPLRWVAPVLDDVTAFIGESAAPKTSKAAVLLPSTRGR